MTDFTPPAAEYRDHRITVLSEHIDGNAPTLAKMPELVARIAELEAQVRRADELLSDSISTATYEAEVEKAVRQAEAERDAALAVIEKARANLRWYSDGQPQPPLDSILASVDTSALAERDAETRRKALEEARAALGTSHWSDEAARALAKADARLRALAERGKE